jgi:plastocyanin
MPTRRRFLGAGVTVASARSDVFEIHMKNNLTGGVVGFDPVGALLRPGQTVRWVCDANVHIATAYSPTNEGHSLRISSDAEPWDWDFLLPGKTFEVTLTVDGVCDYFCMPHEEAGMVGRLIVGKAGGPGTLPFDYQGGRKALEASIAGGAEGLSGHRGDPAIEGGVFAAELRRVSIAVGVTAARSRPAAKRRVPPSPERCGRRGGGL